MAQGWEAFIRLCEHYKGWGTTTVHTIGRCLEVDSESLTPDFTVRERDSKIRFGRESQPESFSVEETKPAGNIVIQPRSDDIPFLLMACLQAKDWNGTVINGYGTGTFTFCPVSTNPDWEGSVWGTVVNLAGTAEDIYPIQVRKCFGVNLDDSLNSEIYSLGIVDSLEFTQAYGADLTVTPTFKFQDVDIDGQTPASYQPNGPYGSYSGKSRFVDWKGTVTFKYGGAATSLDLSNFTVTLRAASSEKGRIGQKGFYRFPFSGRPVNDGSFDLELEAGHFAKVFENAGSAYLKMRWYNSDLDWMEIEMPNIKYRPHDRNISAGDAPITYTLPFRAYPQNGTSSVIVRVCTTFATSGQSLDLVSGEERL